jgi:hypothetical protein
LPYFYERGGFHAEWSNDRHHNHGPLMIYEDMEPTMKIYRKKQQLVSPKL